MSKERKLFFEIIKNKVKLELRDCKIHENLLYINDKLYVSNNLNLRIIIIKDIYNTPFDEYANKSSIYNRLFRYYY